jgi:Flp pilus assembly protein TadG
MPQPFLSRLRRSRPRRSRGQSLVEFALALPLLLIVLLFAIDFGRAFYSWVILQNASRLGANYASLNPELWAANPAALPIEYTNLISKDWGALDCDAPTVPVFTDSPGDTSGAGQTPDTAFDVGDSVRVTLTCPFRPLTPIISGILGNSIQLVATSEFRIRSGGIAGLDNDLQIPKPSVSGPTPSPSASSSSGPTPSPVPTPCPVTAAFVGVPTSGKTPLSVQFTDGSTTSAGCTIATWAWAFGDGQTSTLRNPLHLFTKTSNGNGSQRFDVTLTVTVTPSGSDVEFKNNYIVVSP